MRPQQKIFLQLTVLAIAAKLFLFVCAENYAPSAKFMPDTWRYLQSAHTLIDRGAFAITNPDGTFSFEHYRTPGYPLFLGMGHYFFHMPFTAIVLTQCLLTLSSAWLVYRTAMMIDPRIAQLSALIVLFDFPLTVNSLLLLSDTLFVFFVCCFSGPFNAF